MNRRTALKTTAAAAGAALAAGAVPSADAPSQTTSLEELVICWDRARGPLPQDEALLERVLLLGYDLREALEQLMHAHNMQADDLNCQCSRCYDTSGLAYLLDGLLSQMGTDFAPTHRLLKREESFDKAQAVRERQIRREPFRDDNGK